MSDTVEFTEEAVKQYLDECIEVARNMDDSKMRLHYTDAYQNIRVSLFGETKE